MSKENTENIFPGFKEMLNPTVLLSLALYAGIAALVNNFGRESLPLPKDMKSLSGMLVLSCCYMLVPNVIKIWNFCLKKRRYRKAIDKLESKNKAALYIFLVENSSRVHFKSDDKIAEDCGLLDLSQDGNRILKRDTQSVYYGDCIIDAIDERKQNSGKTDKLTVYSIVDENFHKAMQAREKDFEKWFRDEAKLANERAVKAEPRKNTYLYRLLVKLALIIVCIVAIVIISGAFAAR